MLKLHLNTTDLQAGEWSLDELAREGARRMLMAALEAEVTAYIERHKGERDERGHARVIRNGKAQPRRVTMGSGTVEIAAPRINDRRTDETGEWQRFTSHILPRYMRKSPKVAEVLPILYLRGLSTGDFCEALPVLLEEETSAGLSPTSVLLKGLVSRLVQDLGPGGSMSFCGNCTPRDSGSKRHAPTRKRHPSSAARPANRRPRATFTWTCRGT